MTSSSSNHVKTIAIVGASGNSGSHIANALLAVGTFVLTAVTRHDSTSAFASGLNVIKADYDNHDELVQALRGQDVLIITLSIPSSSQQPKLIRAAADAGVSYIFPNEWSCDTAYDTPASQAFLEAIPIRPLKSEYTALIRSLPGNSKYIALVTGFWYEWSVHGGPEAFGFDFEKKELTLYDEGETTISTMTLAQVGRAVVALLSLPVHPKSEQDKHTGKFLENYANKHVYVSSFTVSQKDIFESVLRATGDSEDEWNVKNQRSAERYAEGVEQLKAGDGKGFVKALHALIFYQDGFGNFEQTRELSNGVLELPEENLDTATSNSFRAL